MKSTRTTANQQGFTLTQMLVTIAIIGVVTTFGVLGIRTARAEFRHQSAARLFAAYAEKARADAIRRHAPAGQESAIETFGPGTTSYAVTMDWGSGVLETRTFELEDGLSFDVAARRITFDWRGRISEGWVFQIKSADLNKNLPVDVSGSGDITVGEQHFPDQQIPDVVITQVTGDVSDPDPTPTPTPTPTPSPTPTPTPTPTPEGPIGPGDPNEVPTPTPPIVESDPGNGNSGGGGSGGNGNGNGNPNASPTPTPTPGGDNPSTQCSATLSPSSLLLSQSDSSRQTGTATLTMVNATTTRTISAAQAANGNSLNVSLSLLRITGNGTSTITVTTKNGAGNRGVFVVNVSADPSCGSTQQLTVSVSN